MNIVKKRRGVTDIQFSVIESCFKDQERVEFDVRQVVVAWSATIKDAKVIPCQY
jgi:hypothetical protein